MHKWCGPKVKTLETVDDGGKKVVALQRFSTKL